MIRLLAVTLAILCSQSLAIKVSVRFSACENHVPVEAVTLSKPDECLLVHYPETDNKDVAWLWDGTSKDGVYKWNAKMGRSLGNQLKIKADQGGTIHLTVKNVVNGKEQKVENLESGQVFDLDDDVIAEDSKSMTLEEFRRLHDVFSEENQEGAQLESRQAVCKDSTYFGASGYCAHFKDVGGCNVNKVFAGKYCKKTCGMCPGDKMPTTTVKTKLEGVTTHKMMMTTTHKMMMTTPPTCTKLPPVTPICTTPKFNKGPAPGPVVG